MLPVSVIIPTFNRNQMCLKALQSIYAQSSLPSQVIVVDDGSTEPLDDVRELLKQRQGLYLSQANLGVAAARNHGVRHASENWIAFLDSDDYWLPAKLEKQFELHCNNPSLIISHTAEVWLRNGARVTQRKHHAPAEGECFSRLLDVCCISASAVMIRRDIFNQNGGFDESFKVCEDYDLWIRLAQRYPVGLVPEPLVVKTRTEIGQLSESVEALDKYRLQALLKLSSSHLSSTQQASVLGCILQKISILEKGARKRDLSGDVLYYQQIRARFKGLST